MESSKAAVHELTRVKNVDTFVPAPRVMPRPILDCTQLGRQTANDFLAWFLSTCELYVPLAVVAALVVVTQAAMVRGRWLLRPFTVRAPRKTRASADEARFVQAYKSGVYSTLPEIEKHPSTANWQVGGYLKSAPWINVVLGHVIGKLPDVKWLDDDLSRAPWWCKQRCRNCFSRRGGQECDRSAIRRLS